MSNRDPIMVSDHAVLRWLERVEGVDVARIRRRIRRAVINGVRLGAASIKLDGVEYRVVVQPDGAPVVTTTVSRQERPHLAVPRIEPGSGCDEELA